MASSLRRARCGLPLLRKYCSSSKVGLSGEQSRRETAKAPQALAQVAAVARLLAAEPAAQEAGHEGVAGAEHVVDLDREALADDAVLEIVGNRALVDDATHRAALEDDGGGSQRTDRLECRQQFAFARGDQDFLFRADDQVAARQDRLHSFGDSLRGDVAVVAGIVPGETPEIGAVIDVEHDLAAVRAHQLHRLALCGLRAGAGEMRAGDDDGASLRDEGGIDVAFLQRHVGAVLAVEQQREGLVALDREDGERGQPLRIGLEAVEIHPLAGELLAQETAELLVADAGQQGRAQAETGRADGDIGRAAADRFGEGGDVFEP
ncbi:hypothetical protein BTHI11S_02897 [Bosea thiooxidans]